MEKTAGLKRPLEGETQQRVEQTGEALIERTDVASEIGAEGPDAMTRDSTREERRMNLEGHEPQALVSKEVDMWAMKKRSGRQYFHRNRKEQLDISHYVKKSMLEDPWKGLERQLDKSRVLQSEPSDKRSAKKDMQSCKDDNVVELDLSSSDSE